MTKKTRDRACGETLVTNLPPLCDSPSLYRLSADCADDMSSGRAALPLRFSAVLATVLVDGFPMAGKDASGGAHDFVAVATATRRQFRISARSP